MRFIKNIKRWIKKHQCKMELKYQKHTINIEISSVCNARCSYCPTGVGKHSCETKFMSPKLFEKIIKHLLKTNIMIPNLSVICLFSWGEPFIHPQLNEILSILGKYNLQACISSNFINFPKISNENYKNINTIMFSLCSLNKETYKKIYKADLDKVLENYNKFIKQKNKFNPTMEMSVHWIKYTFNKTEFDYAKQYFSHRNVFNINDNHYAMLADINVWLDLAEGKNNTEDMKYYDMEQAFNDIYFDREQKIIEKYAPEEINISECRQMQMLTIGEEGQLVGCCSLYSKHNDYNLGSFLKMSKEKVYKLQHSMKICKRCCENKLAWYCHNFLNYHDKDIEDLELIAK